MRRLLIILGVPIDDLTMAQALDRLEHFITVGRATGKSHQIATINADFVVKALHDPELRHILLEADMATADGMPLVLGSRLLGVPLTGRVTGADMVPALAERAAEKHYSIFLLGAKPGVAAHAAEVLKERYPGLPIAGVISPANASVLEMDIAILEDLKASKPDILLVAFGNPKQEKWISMYAKELAIPVCIGVGGTLDMIAGTTRRAPVWMQQCGLEWLFRLLQEPGRLWKRYILDLLYFNCFFIRQWWAMRKDKTPSTILPVSGTILVDDIAIINIHGRMDQTNQAEFVAEVEQALAITPRLVVNLAEATFLDSSTLGTLVAIANRARAAGGMLRLVAVPPSIAQILSLVRLDRFFAIHEDIDVALTLSRAHVRPFTEPAQDLAGWSVMKMPRTLDADCVPKMVHQCSTSLRENPRLILDFSETVFLSSAGLAAMAKLNRQAKDCGGELRLACCSRDVLYGIRTVRLDKMLQLYHDVRAAAL